MLSSQTKDEVTHGKSHLEMSHFYYYICCSAFCILLINFLYLLSEKKKIGAIERLSENGLLDPEAIVKTDEATIRDLIRPVCNTQKCRICMDY
jgi:hypothetical protein